VARASGGAGGGGGRLLGCLLGSRVCVVVAALTRSPLEGGDGRLFVLVGLGFGHSRLPRGLVLSSRSTLRAASVFAAAAL